MKNKKGLTVFIIFLIVIILLGSANIILSTFGITNSNTETIKQKDMEKSNWGYIASVKISGVIEESNEFYNQAWLLNIISKLKNDSSNVALALFIDSPGGNVYQSDEIFLALKDYKESKKPLYVYMGQMAASGAYYISVASDKIYANRNTLTGSIGVIAGHSIDATEFLSKIGIKSTTIHSGKNKTMMNYDEPLTEEQIKIMQEISDECYQQFTEIVALERNIPIVELKKIADGRIFTASQAKKHNLIDEISSYDQMIIDLEKNELFNTYYKIKNFEYQPEFSLANFIFGSITKTSLGKAISSEFQKGSLTYPAFIYK